MGHIMRCLALAEMVQAAYDIHFVCRAAEPSIQALILEHRFSLINLEENVSPEEALTYFFHTSSSCLIVLDGYHFTAEYEKELIAAGHKVLSIDDLHKRSFYADAVLNHAGGVEATSYRTGLHTRICLGPDYALVREVFRATVSAEKEKGSLLLAMGGADPANITQQLLSLLAQTSFSGPVTVVLGPAYRHELKVPENFPIKLIRNASPPQLVDLYRKAEIVLLPSSTMAYEACSARATVICGILADNQKLLHHFLVENQLALNAGLWQGIDAEELEAIIQQALQPQFQQKQLHVQQVLFDHQQKDRILKLFRKMQKEMGLQIRRAAASDCRLYFHWANDTETRKQAINQEPIPWENHVGWFEKKLLQKDAYLYIVEQEGTAVGQVRFDAEPEAEDTFVISYSLAPEARGKGLGEAVLQKALRQLQFDVEQPLTLTALVKEGNTASFRIFENLSFTSVGKTEVKKEGYWEFRKSGI